MDKKEKIFVDGLIFKKPREGAPDFVKGNISIKVAELTAFLKKHDNNGWVNIDLKMSKEGKLYCELNNYKRDADSTNISKPFVTSLTPEEIQIIQNARKASAPVDEINAEDIPFN